MAAQGSYEAILPLNEVEPQSIRRPSRSQPTPHADIIAALRTIAPLNGLTEAEYAWLATHCDETVGDDGAIVFLEGNPCDRLHFILMGEIHVRRRHAGPTLFIGRAGQMTGKLPFSRMKTYGGDGFTVGPRLVAQPPRVPLPRTCSPPSRP